MRGNQHQIFTLVIQTLYICLLALITTAVMAGEDNAFGEPDHKIVIQVSTADTQVQKIALNNAVNVRKKFGVDEVQVEIVVYGPGLTMLIKGGEYAEQISSMAMQGVRFSACHNTIEAVKRKTGKIPELVDGVEVVPSGVGRIVSLQEQGYAYVRP